MSSTVEFHPGKKPYHRRRASSSSSSSSSSGSTSDSSSNGSSSSSSSGSSVGSGNGRKAQAARQQGIWITVGVVLLLLLFAGGGAWWRISRESAASTTSSGVTASPTAAATGTGSGSESVASASQGGLGSTNGAGGGDGGTESTSGAASSGDESEPTASSSGSGTGTAAAAATGTSSSETGGTSPSSAASPASSNSASSTSTSNTTTAASTTSKAIYAHFLVGVAYGWTTADWITDITLASQGGFDGFALNAAGESQTVAGATDLSTAFAAAKQFGTSFSLFISFDMTVFPCNSSSDASILIALSKLYATHPNQATYKTTGRPIFSTFGGSDCTFGQSGAWADAWDSQVLKPLASQSGKDPFFIPAMYEVYPPNFSGMSALDGVFDWQGGWMFTYANITRASDQAYSLSNYGASSWNKNYLLYSDGFLLAKRWDVLMAHRDAVDLIEAVTWNDFGESTYLTPTSRGTDSTNQVWAAGLEHSSLLTVNLYYSQAWKTGNYPTISKDVIHLSARPHPNGAKASSDPVGPPAGGSTGGNVAGPQWEIDSFFALIFSTGSASVTMTSGTFSNTFTVAGGVTHLSSPLQPGSGMSATMSRGGSTVASLKPTYTFVTNPTTYNFNYYYFSS